MTPALKAVLEKVVKLRRLAGSDNANEARAAAEAAARLVQEHRLSEAEIAAAGAAPVEEMVTGEAGTWWEGKAVALWQGALATVLADHFGCVVYRVKNRLSLEKEMRFAGRADDVAVCLYFHAWLSGVFQRAALGRERGERRAFLCGCVVGLRDALAVREAEPTPASTALVALNAERSQAAHAALGPMPSVRRSVAVACDSAFTDGTVEGAKHSSLARPLQPADGRGQMRLV